MSMAYSEPPSATTIIPGFTRGSDDHLPLVAARLVVVLDRDRALRLQPLNVIARVFELLDARKAFGSRAINHVASREDTRREQMPAR